MHINFYRHFIVLTAICLSILPATSQENMMLAPQVLNAGDSLLIKELYFQGVQQKSAGQLAAAEKTFDKLVLLQPDNDAAHFELARLYFEKEDYEAAEESAMKAARLSPANEWYWITLLDIHKETGDFNKIPSVLDQLIQLNPEKESHYYDKAYALYLNEEYVGAMAVYDQIAAKFGKSAEQYIIRHQVYLAQGDLDSAIVELETLVATGPPDSKGHILLAGLYTNSGRPKKAITLLEDATGLFPDDPLIVLAKSDAYLAMGRKKQAYTSLREVLENKALDIDAKAGILYTAVSNERQPFEPKLLTSLADLLTEVYPREPKAHAVRGDIYLQLNQPEHAREAYLRALDINRYVEGLWQQLLQTELQTGRYADVGAHGEEALGLFPNHPLILFFTGHGFLGTKQYDKARTYFEASLNSTDPENIRLLTQLYSNLGDVYHALELYAESDVAYEEAIALDSTNAYALNNYAYYLALRKEKLPRAAEMSKKSNDLEPGFASYEDTYAWVLFQQGEYDEALVWIKRAVDHADAASDTLLEHYGDILAKLGRIEEAVVQWEKARALAASVGKDIELLMKKINEKRYIE